MQKHRIPETVPEMPVTRYLTRAYPMAPAWAIRDALSKRDVRINGEKISGTARVKGGDEITVYLPDQYLTGDVRVLFCDNHLLAVEKPVGLPVDVDQDDIGADTLRTRLAARYPGVLLCHRLDTGTGGVLLCALEPDTHEKILKAFYEHRVRKIYQAICVGQPPAKARTLYGFLKKDAKRGVVRVGEAPAPGALPIETRYRVLEAPYHGDEGLALLEIELITGRTHQIRAHMAAVSLPLLGDDKYGDRAVNRFYHASEPALFCVSLKLDVPGYEGRTFAAQPAFTK